MHAFDSASYSEWLSSVLCFCFSQDSPSAIERFIQSNSEEITTFFSCNKPLNSLLYIYQSADKTDLQLASSPSFPLHCAHICIFKWEAEGKELHHSFNWVPAGCSLGAISALCNQSMVGYLESALENAAASESKQKNAIGVALKKLKELEYTLSSVCNTHEIPPISPLQLPGFLQEQQCQLPAEREKLLEAFERDPPKEHVAELVASISRWSSQVQRATKIPFSQTLPTFDSFLQEIAYWEALEVRIREWESVLEGENVVFCLELLKKAKKFHITMGFLDETGIREAIEFVGQKKLAVRDVPLNELFSSAGFEELFSFIPKAFSHFNKKAKSASVSAELLVHAIECISDEFFQKTVQIASTHSSKACLKQNIFEQTKSLFNEWDNCIKETQSLLREQARKKTGKYSGIKIVPSLSFIVEGMEEICSILSKHDSLMRELEAVKELEEFYDEEFASIVFSLGLSISQISSPASFSGGIQSLYSLIQMTSQKYSGLMEALENKISCALSKMLANEGEIECILECFARFSYFISLPNVYPALKAWRDKASLYFQQELENLQRQSESSLLKADADSPCKKFEWISGFQVKIDQLSRQLCLVFGSNWYSQLELSNFYAEILKLKNKFSLSTVADEWIADLVVPT